MFDRTPIHHKGLMLVTNEYKTNKLPVYFLGNQKKSFDQEPIICISVSVNVPGGQWQ